MNHMKNLITYNHFITNDLSTIYFCFHIFVKEKDWPFSYNIGIKMIVLHRKTYIYARTESLSIV